MSGIGLYNVSPVTSSTDCAGKSRTCPYCGCWPHSSIESCPRIKSVEYYPDGHVKRVELK